MSRLGPVYSDQKSEDCGLIIHQASRKRVQQYDYRHASRVSPLLTLQSGRIPYPSSTIAVPRVADAVAVNFFRQLFRPKSQSGKHKYYKDTTRILQGYYKDTTTRACSLWLFVYLVKHILVSDQTTS